MSLNLFSDIPRLFLVEGVFAANQNSTNFSEVCLLSVIRVIWARVRLGHMSLFPVTISSVKLLPCKQKFCPFSFSGRASASLWFVTHSLTPYLCFSLSSSPIQSAVSAGSDGDEEGGWGQRHVTLPPPVPIVQLAWHRVAVAETKFQTESGEIIFCPCWSKPSHFGLAGLVRSQFNSDWLKYNQNQWQFMLSSNLHYIKVEIETTSTFVNPNVYNILRNT